MTSPCPETFAVASGGQSVETPPKSESEFTVAMFEEMAKEKRDAHIPMLSELNERYNDRVFVLPTSRAMVLAVDYYLKGKLPGIDGIHKVVGGKERSLWRDRLGHLGPGLEHLEGYVFYAAMYGRSPELIEKELPAGGRGAFPSAELDRAFKEIAWKAAVTDPLSGVSDDNGNGISDDRE